MFRVPPKGVVAPPLMNNENSLHQPTTSACRVNIPQIPNAKLALGINVRYLLYQGERSWHKN